MWIKVLYRCGALMFGYCHYWHWLRPCICKTSRPVMWSLRCAYTRISLSEAHFCPSKEKESEKRRMWNNHETCDNKKQVFEMDPKQRERSARQSNFILQMTGLGRAATRAKRLECRCRPDKPNLQSRAVVCARCALQALWTWRLIFSLSPMFVWFIVRADLHYLCYYKDGVSF